MKLKRIKSIPKKIINKIKNREFKKWEIFFPFIIFIIIFLHIGFRIDNDSYFILNTGKYILNNGFTNIEPFTVHEGLRYMPQQWLTSVLLYKLNDIFGVYGLFSYVTILYSFLIFIIYKLCNLVNNKNRLISVISTIVIAYPMTLFFIRTRPQLISYVLLLSFIYILEYYFKTGKKKVLWLLPVISILQINFHAACWWMEFIYAIPYLIEALYDKFIKHKKNIYDYRWIIISLCASFAIGLVNPYTSFAMCYFIFGLFNKSVSRYVYEMKQISPFTILYIYSFVVLLLSLIGIKRNSDNFKIRFLFILLGSLILAFSNFKSVAYLLLFTPMILSALFRDIKIKESKEKFTKKSFNYKVTYILVIMCILNYSYFYFRGPFIFSMANYLNEGVQSLIEEYDVKEIKLYANYNNGGYTEYCGLKSYIDPRAEVFYKTMNQKEEIFDEYYNLQVNNIEVKEFLDKYNFTHILATSDDVLYSDEAVLENYTKFKEYDGYKIFVRKDLKK